METEDLRGLKLDKWQKEVLEHEGNICIRAGRQVGKSTVIAIKAHDFAKENPGTVTLVIAASQRQSSYLFGKIRLMFDEDEEAYSRPPTLTRIELKNGSKIYCLPTGKTGIYIRGYTVDLLIADEAAYIGETVWLAILPMIAVSQKMRGKGWIILLSTPFGKGGYYYECFTDEDFKQFHVSSENCPRISKKHLLKRKKQMSKIEYAQEYLGEFVDEWRQFFSTALIKSRMTFIDWDYKKDYNGMCRYYLGIDVARYGRDENAFVIVELNHKNQMKIIKAMVTEKKATTDTIGFAKKLHGLFKFRQIFVDDTGIGGGVTDALIEEFGSRVIGINNASKSISKGQGRRRILKEDLYSNLLVLMEQKKIEIISDLKLLRSLKSMTYEYTKDKSLRIHGKYSHLSEAAVRAAWAIKSKGLKLFIA